MIAYRDDIREFALGELQELFLSVGWSSGHYPEQLTQALHNCPTLITAWDGERLIGLVNALDDGVMTAYVHYLLVHPDYQRLGIGRQLMERCAAEYRDYLRIVLVAYPDGVAFYEGCGFKASESVPMYLTKLWT